MSARCLVVLTLALSTAAGAQPPTPDTPAGRTLAAWLDAFNSGDRERMDAHYRRYEPSKSADEEMRFRKATGGFDLQQILKSEPLRVEFLVKERNSETRGIGVIAVNNADARAVTQFAVAALPPGTTAADADFHIDAATRSRVIDSVVADLTEFYVFADVAKRMTDAIRARQRRGEYDKIADGDVLATRLTTDLRDVSHDGHLRVEFSPVPEPNRPPPTTPGADTLYRKRMQQVNCGFERVEVMPANIGYLKFNFFGSPDICGPTATAAMNFLANVDALIVDLRDNGGGDPAMVAFISSYLFAEPTHLNDLWTRKDSTTHQYWTLPYVPGKRLDGARVYVLTSKRTFSGAEEFTYNLKNLKRATIVGETTGGGAHPVSGHRIDDRFSIGVPFATAINPISKTSWEGAGVEPDVKVAAGDALSTAQTLAGQAH
jgi:retinol-binding protein 3